MPDGPMSGAGPAALPHPPGVRHMPRPALSSTAAAGDLHRAAAPWTTLLAVLFAAWSGDDGPTQPPVPVASTLDLWAAAVTFSSLTDIQHLTATVKDQNWQPTPGAQLSWSSVNASVPTVSSTGLVTSVANGTATIIAASGAGELVGPGDRRLRPHRDHHRSSRHQAGAGWEAQPGRK
ncbi:MAG: hypothetical protein FIA95_07700, partial [Gemmatimonadetes bacterium]|nr:hypothetical protein [Gemmatimonadota bacterium]